VTLTATRRINRFAGLAIAALILGLYPWTGGYAEEQVAAQDKAGPGPNAIPRGPDDISTRIEADTRPQKVTFDFPGIDRFFKPWDDWKSRIAEEHGFRLGFDYQPAIQWANNSVGDDSAAGGIFRAFSSWDIWNRDNSSRKGTLDVRIEHRHRIGTDLPPESLAPNFGWLGTTAPDWSDQGLGLTVFMLKQRLDVGDAPIELRVGRMSAFAQFDITPYSDNLTVFMNNSIILSPTIAYPSAGSFGIAGYLGIPNSKLYALGMFMDANGSYDDLGFDSLKKDEFFKALEFGWSDQDLSGFGYLFNNVHAAIWESDNRGWGAGLTGSYTFTKQRLGTFARVAWASDDAATIYEKYAAAGVTKSVYKDSLMGLGASWGQAHNSDIDQYVTEIFYRWQMSQNLALTPDLQFLFNPTLNTQDDVVTVFGIRARITF
jgi:porin